MSPASWGGQNVFAGRVSGIADGVIALDLSERGRIEFPASDPVPSIGSTVHVSIRRDALTTRRLLGVPNFRCRLGCIEVRRVEIIFAGNPRQCEKGITPRISERRAHSFGARHVVDGANWP